MTFERPNKLLWIVALVIVGFCTAQTKRKIIIDQDARGPATTDQQSILLLLQSPQVETLGITVVSGDQWRDEEVAHTLRMLELTEHTDVKVYPGAVFPLINSKEEIARAGNISTVGSTIKEPGTITRSGRTPVRGTWGSITDRSRSQISSKVNPTTKPAKEDAAHFIIRMVHQYPDEVTIYAGGPLTNLAQAISLDPETSKLAHDLVGMGGSVSPTTSMQDATSNRREFNFWWDPEAVHIVLRAPWHKITVTTVDISIKTRLTKAMIAEIGKASSPAAKYVRSARRSFQRDEQCGAAWMGSAVGVSAVDEEH